MDISTSDFAEVCKSSYYVDKTLFIEDFMTAGPSVKVITAPPRFGKSTKVDMLKRFLSIEVNESGNTTEFENSENYKLFCDQPFNICHNESFVKEHFGQYPVVAIDYKPLKHVYDFQSMLDRMRLVIFNTFDQHNYLALNSSLFPSELDIELFLKHCSKAGSKELTAVDINDAFLWLTKLLYTHFNRPVIVLLDEYDSYFSSLLLKNIDDTDKIIDFLEGVNSLLFKSNMYLEKGLLTGVLRIQGIGIAPSGSNYAVYMFLGDHKFSQYYGFKENEVDNIIERNVDVKSRGTVQEHLKENYDGYEINKQQTKCYPISSIIEYFRNNMTIEGHWIHSQSMDNVLRNEILYLVVEEFPRILSNSHVYVDISQPLTVDVIDYIKHIKNNSEFSTKATQSWFYTYIYDLGYLTISNKIGPKLKANYTNSISYAMVIPSSEMRKEYERFLWTCYQKLFYSYVDSDATGLYHAMNQFTSDVIPVEKYRTLYQAVFEIIHISQDYPKSRNELRSIILYLLSKKFSFAKRIAYKLETSFIFDGNVTVNFEKVPYMLLERAQLIYSQGVSKIGNSKHIYKIMGRIDLLLVNDHDVAIVLEIKFRRSSMRNHQSLYELSEDALLKVLLWHGKFLSSNTTIINGNEVKIREKIYIGIGFDERSRNMAMSFYCPSPRSQRNYVNIYKKWEYD